MGPQPAFEWNAPEPTPESALLHYSDQFSYAQSQAQRGNLQEALTVFARLAAPGENGTASPVPEALRRQALIQMEAIQGTNGFTPERAEFLLQNLLPQIFDPAALGAMVGAGATFKVARFGLLGSAARVGLRSRWVEPAASLLAFGAEAGSFPIHHRLLGQSLGQEVDWSNGALFRDMQSSFLVLGGLRLSGAAGTRLFDQVHGIRTAFTPELYASRQAFQNGSLFAGVLLGHGLEQAFDLAPPQDALQFLAESFVTFLHFKAAERIIPSLSGPRFQQWEHELETQTRFLASHIRPRTRAEFRPLLQPLTASAGIPQGLEGRPIFPISPHSQSLGGSKPHLVFSLGGSRSTPTPPATPELARLIREFFPPDNTQPSELLEPFAQEFRQTLLELQAGNVGREEANLRLGEILQADWIQRMREVGVRVSHHPLIDFLRDKFKGRELPDWLLQIAEDPTLQNSKMIEIYADAAAHKKAESDQYADSMGSFAFAVGAMDALAMRLSLPQSTFTEIVSLDPQELRTYIPAVPFLIKVVRIPFNTTPLDYELTPTLSSDLEVRNLLAAGRRPWLMTERFVGLHEFDRAHPYSAWVHDAFHMVDLGQIPVETRRILPRIYDYFSRMQPGNPAEKKLQRDILPHILEGEVLLQKSLQSIIYTVKGSPTSREFRDRVIGDLREIIGTETDRESSRPGGLDEQGRQQSD